MTTDTKFNKYFIHDCIKKSVKKVKKKPELRGVEFEILEGVTGEPGSVAVASKISNERIPKCDIFIADLSVVNYTNAFGRLIRKISKDPYKPFQNNNVILEYGIAYSKLGEEKIIGILNNEFGSPNENPDNIPFDIQHLRFPIEYKYSKKYSDKAKAQEQLISGLAGAIKTTALAALTNQKDRYRPFITWSEWNSLTITTQKFYSNIVIEDVKTKILSAVEKPEHSIRFLGLSGLGKTRMLLECFRPQEAQHESLLRSSDILYINCNLYGEINFTELFNKLVEEKENKVLILDNCSTATHRSVLQILPPELSKTLIISVDSNPEELDRDKINGVNYVSLRKEDLQSIVEQILSEDFSVLGQHIDKIKEFSQGIPLMAVLIGESIKNGEKFIGKLDDTELLNKLLGQKANHPRTRQILMSCAIFNHFGAQDEVSSQIEFIASNKNITPIDGSDPVVIKEFHEISEFYLKREIFERRGRYLSMRPFPLAMYLASEWLLPCTPERLIDVIKDIAHLEDPDRKILSDSLAEQMKFLGYNDKAVKIVENIVGIGSPFDNAEVLNTKLGSRLFRSFVEVNPVAVSQCLNRVIGSLSSEELLEFKEGRRNIIWTLDKLVFDNRTFDDGVKLLFKFSISENEDWANNATSQLTHLFSIYLSGTEANLESRFRIIDWALQQNDDQYTKLALDAMNRGLDFGNFTRMGGAERRGTRKLLDNEPTPEEIKAYWQSILEKLESIITESEIFRDRALEVLSHAIFSVIRANLSNLILPFIQRTAEFLSWDWDSGLNAIKHSKKYDSHNLVGEQLEIVNDLIAKLSKSDFASQYQNFDSNYHLENPGKYSSAEVRKGIANLADVFIEEEISWKDTLPKLYESPQAYAFYFGKRLYEILVGNENRIDEFINISIGILSTAADSARKNIMLLRGFVSNFEEKPKSKYYETLEQYENLHYLIFQSVSDEADGKERLDYLFELIEKGIGKIENFESFYYGEAIQNMSLAELEKFSEQLFKNDIIGTKILFEILFNLGFNDRSLRSEFKPLLKSCIQKLWVSEYNSQSTSGFKWSQTICEILESPDEKDFAIFINREVINSIDIKNSYHLDHDIQRIYSSLIDNHCLSIWPELSAGLVGVEEDYIKYYGLKHILGSHIGGLSSKSGLIQKIGDKVIFEWCEENKPLAASRLAEMIPIYKDGNKDYSEWSPIAKKLIDQYGNFDEVLMYLSINMGSYSWTGSLVPLLESKRQLFEKLVDHKYKEVQTWAKNELSYLQEKIKNETNRDQEMFL